MYAYVYIIKIWYLLVSNSIVGEFPVQSGCTLWLAPGWRDPGGDGIRMWKMDEHGDWLEHILCILTHINVTENIGTSLEFTSINIGKWLWKSTVHGTMATIELLEKNLWKVEFPLWRKRWYSKKNDNNDNFCCSIGICVDYILIVFFSHCEGSPFKLTLMNIVWGWCIDDCELTHWIRYDPFGNGNSKSYVGYVRVVVIQRSTGIHRYLGWFYRLKFCLFDKSCFLDLWAILPGLVNVYKKLWKDPPIFNGKTHYKWQFSIAMLNYQRVYSH